MGKYNSNQAEHWQLLQAPSIPIGYRVDTAIISYIARSLYAQMK